MPIGNGFGGGRNLGIAQGAIYIDTSSVEKAAVTVKRVSREIKQGMEGIGGSNVGTRLSQQFQSAGRNLQAFSKQVKGLRDELLAVGVAGGVLAGIGLKTAAGIQEATIQLKGMVGSEQAAVKLMTELRKQASAAGVPFADILGASRLLLPTLQGNTEELEKWLPLIRRVAVLNQREGLTGAGFAINEALSSGGTDLVSLTERFSISRTQLREALAQTGGDFAAALDIVLTRMGITIETADEMGTTFNASLNAAKDAAAQLLAAGFQPLLETMTPIIRRTADWLNELRQSNPEIAKVGAGIAAIAAVGAPTLLFLGQMVESIGKIKKAIDSINAAKLATLGNLAKGGLAVAGGIGLGIGVSRGIGRATGNDALANADLNTLWTQIKQILFTILAGLSEVFKQVGNLFLNSAEGFNRALVNMINGMAGFVRFIASVLPDELGGDRLTGIADNLDNFAQRLLETSQQRIDDARTRLDQGQENFLKGALDFLGLGGSGAAGGAGGVGSPGGGGAADTAAQERETALKEYHEGLKQIEINRLKQIADATEQYADQRADAIEQYERQAAREQEDFLRQRRRQEEQFARDVERINRERYEREAEWAADLAERINELRTSSDDRIAEIREEGNERIADIEEDYRQDRERREREHRLSLLSAAARLDASAIAEEQRRYKEQNQTAEEQLEERLQDEQEQLAERLENERQNLEERIQQEQEAHHERIQEAREADAKRIADMREALNEQQRIEDEDRAIRLARSKEDHQLQLQALQEAHNQRMQQIAEQAAEERRLLKEQFEEKMDLLNEQHQQETTYQQIGEAARGGGSSGGSGSIGGAFGFANGGPVYGTGMAMLHGSRTRPEYVLDGATTAALRSVLGNFNQASLLGAVAGNGRSNTFNMQSGAIQIHAAPGQSAGDIGAEVEAAMYRFFESVGAG